MGIHLWKGDGQVRWEGGEFCEFWKVVSGAGEFAHSTFLLFTVIMVPFVALSRYGVVSRRLS